jgi:hypothetical protein
MVSYLSRFYLLAQKLLEYFYSQIFQRFVCIAAGNKMAWHCIRLDYSAYGTFVLPQMSADGG